MSVKNLRKLESQFLKNDNRIDEAEAKQLLESAKQFGVTKSEKAELQALVGRNKDRFDGGAAKVLEAYFSPTKPPVANEVIRSVAGPNPATFEDDKVFLGRDGTISGKADVSAYTRNYASIKEGPLRFRHGSAVPESSVVPAADLAAAKANTPGKALDAAAAAFGVQVSGFESMANSTDFFNDKAEHWWGKCHAWTWSALNKTINKLVDVEGPEGQRGLWVGGQFMSRADLGNWMMATADKISIHDSNQYMKLGLSPMDLLKGTTQFMMNNGGGVVADVWNDAKKGHKEVWNQPFVGADVTNTTLTGEVATKLLDQAKADGVTGVAVKQVTIVGTYGVEQTDGHEGAPGTSSKTWQMYVVTDDKGQALTSYMADDKKLSTIAGLPTTYTDDIPEYFWKPTLQALEDTLAGKQNNTVDWDSHGAEFKFFVGTVLKSGVPATTRAAFEAEFQALPAGAINAATVTALSQKYPGVANAYSPDQWKTIFAPRGLSAKSFGAVWPN